MSNRGRASARAGMMALAAAVVTTLTGCTDLLASASTPAAGTTTSPSSGPATPSPDPDPDPAGSGDAEPSTAQAALADLEVKGRAPRTGYDRELFGPGWGDPDRNGCDARNDILARDLAGETFKPGTRDCVVLTGTLADPYSGTVIEFRRGQDTSADVQIDHVVAVSDAWQKGAQAWDAERRVAFYSDPLNLLAVDGELNQQKGDGDAATWLPPHRAYRCDYVARQIAVKATYGLWVTQAEREVMLRVLAPCPDHPLPVGGLAPGPGSGIEPGSATSYANCAAVRAAGAAPIHQGDPGYGRHLDGDGDGIGCE